MKRLMVVPFVAAAFLACGPGAKIGGGKEGAAQALFAASSVSNSGGSGGSGIDVGNVSVSCPKGGKANLSAVVDVNSLSGLAAGTTNVKISYAECGLAGSDVGTAIYNGALTVAQKFAVTSGSATVSQKFGGKVLLQGAFDDFIDANVTQEIVAGKLSSTSGAVAMKLVGTITTSSGTHSFDEEINVNVGTIKAEVTKK